MKTKIPEVMKSLQNTSHIPPKIKGNKDTK
jgi:hypothetical protein